MGEQAMPAARLLAALAVVPVSLALLAGCTGQDEPAPAPSATAVVPAPTESAAALIEGGTAEENKPFFDSVVTGQLAADPESGGRAIIDALSAAGFIKTDMQVTSDTTSIGLDAASIQFSVKLGDSCLVGQSGADSGGYRSIAVAPTSTGTCLVGRTVAIDW